MVDGYRRAPRLILATVATLAVLAPYASHAEDASCPGAVESPQPTFPPSANPLDQGPVPLLAVVASDSDRADELQHQALHRLGIRGTLVSQTDQPSCWITSRRCFVDVPGGAADRTLPELARQLGLRGFLRTRVLRDRDTPPIRGCYSVASAFSVMFSGTPVSFELTDDALTVIPGHPDPSTIYFDVPAGDAATTLTEWTHQAGLQVLFHFLDVKGHDTGPLQGYFHPDQALQALLAGTPLVSDWVDEHTLAILRPTPSRLARDHRSWWKRLWNGLKTKPHPAETSASGLAEVVIAGDQVKVDSFSVGAPLNTVTRADIDSTGLTTVPDLTRTLPQVWGGGPTDHTQLGREALTNSTFGTGFNLRGLDAGATVVLVDGQRPAGSGTAAEYVDISNIPLSAIDHIDTVADGSSIQNGADAVAGVVNFVTRKDFEGLEVEANAGEAIGEVRGQSRFSGIFGKHWDSGKAMVALELDQQAALPAAARSQATNNLTPFGGSNFDQPYGNPGTLVIGAQTWAIPNLDGQPLTTSALQPGTLNLYDQRADSDVLPSRRRLSLVTSLSQELGGHAEVWFDSWLSRRHDIARFGGQGEPLIVPANNPYYINPSGGNGPVGVLYGFGRTLGPRTGNVDVSAGSMTLGVRYEIAGWNFSGSVGYAFERGSSFFENLVNSTALNAALSSSNPSTAFDPFGLNTNASVLQEIRATYTYRSSSAIDSLNVTANRPLIQWPGGPVTLSTGAQYRQEILDAAYGPDYVGSPGYLADYSRHVVAGFASLRVPVITEHNSQDWTHRLEFSLGARYEHHEQFGGVWAPKLGALWAPVPQVAIRATWGRAFRPPAMTDLDESRNQSGIAVLSYPSSSTGIPALVWQGGNPDLRLERSTTWTLGSDFTPVPDLSLGLTYFEIADRGRIDQLVLTHNSLTDTTFLGSITWNPTLIQRQQVCEHSTFSGPIGPIGGCLTVPIAAIIDLRSQNLDTLKTNGVDMSARFQPESLFGRLELGVDATYLLKFAQARGPSAPALNLLDIQHEPIDWRARAKAGWKWKSLTTTAFVNFTDSYRDTASVPSRTVSSWTTVDVDLEYGPSAVGPVWLQETTLGFSAQNVMDSRAPFLNNAAAAIGYDQENASLVGRVLGFRIRHKW